MVLWIPTSDEVVLHKTDRLGRGQRPVTDIKSGYIPTKFSKAEQTPTYGRLNVPNRADCHSVRQKVQTRGTPIGYRLEHQKNTGDSGQDRQKGVPKSTLLTVMPNRCVQPRSPAP